MSTLKFDVKLENLPGFRADALIGHSMFDVLEDPRDLRQFRSSLLEIAKMLSGDSRLRGILIVDESQIGDDRLREEWIAYEPLFRPEIFERITLVIRREDALNQVFGHLSDRDAQCIEPVIESVRQRASRPMRRPSEAFFDILRVLLVHWFRKSGPLTSKELAAQTGFSYPTIANALEKLEPHLLRHSDRRVELRAFPRDAWFKLLAQGEKVRVSQGFTDPSGRPRSPEVLMERFRELDRNEVAVAGVLGARHYLPGLDLAGTPRLDLVVHAPRPSGPQTFLRRLDPALRPAMRGEHCHVVVHTVFRPEPFFSQSENGSRWADEVECLLDLHEMRLESQALEFFEHLVSRAGGRARILVVEDNNQVAEIILNALKSLGHKVVIAQTGATALRRFSDALSSGEPFDLVFLDAIFAGGVDKTFEVHEILKIDPKAKVIAVSAHSLDPDALLRKGFAGVLSKAFLIADLERILREVLSQSTT